ncbi:MAG TPA: flagellar M-ring protein FliF [Verrucomicrobia bacterium]|nr:flagellar M-ring protein FliF [Verrucomicrobiota bacterium]
MSELALNSPVAGLQPAENETANIETAQTQSQADGSSEPQLPVEVQQSAIVRFIEQPAVKQALPAVLGLMLLIVCVLFYFWISAPGYRSVYPGMLESDRQAAYDLLSTSAYEVFIDSSSGELQVPTDRYHEARILLASQNIPRSAALGSLGALVEQGSITTSRFMEQVSYRAAMENELAKTISQIGSINSVRVHIAESQQSVFVRNQTPSKASVIVRPYPGRVVSRSQIQAIVHLVSSSIPYLIRENVTVVDDTGRLLTDSDSDAAMALTAAQSEHKRSVEASYQKRIQQLMSAVVGLGNVRTEVDVVLNFAEIESTTEEFDRGGLGPRTRSESLQIERDAGSGASGVPGSFSNEPPASPTFTETNSTIGAESANSEDLSSSSSTRNYELDREIRYVKQQVGSIEKISVAVVVNKTVYSDAEGVVDEQELGLRIEQIEKVVRGAIGFVESRGDLVTVVAAEFAKPVEELQKIPWYLEADKLNGFVRMGAVFLLLFFVYFTMARPFLKSLKEKKEFEIPMELEDPDNISDEERQLVEMGDIETIKDVTARLKPKAVGIPAEYLDTSQPYDQKVALMRFLVKDDVGRVSNLLKRWIEE